jgi:hypothetical protein
MQWFKRIRYNLYAIELIELLGLGLLLSLFIYLSTGSPKNLSVDEVGPFLMLVFGGICLWGAYLLYIRLARAGGPIADIGLWVSLSFLTASFTFWCWTILDLNRGFLSWLFYEGETPVEYAWSISSKRRRKEYDLENKLASQTAAQRAQSAAEQPLPTLSEQQVADLLNPSVYTRKDAAKKLGELTESHERIVTALLTAKETDSHLDVRNAAAALLAPVHQVLLQGSEGCEIDLITQ